MPAEPARLALVKALENAPETASNFVIRGLTLADCDIARFDLTRDMAFQVIEDVTGAVEALTSEAVHRL